MEIVVRGECSTCGVVIPYGDDSAVLFLTVPGRGAFAKTVWQAELRCKNGMLCSERAQTESNPEPQL